MFVVSECHAIEYSAKKKKKRNQRITFKNGARLKTSSLFPNLGGVACNSESTQLINMLSFVGHAVSDVFNMLNCSSRSTFAKHFSLTWLSSSSCWSFGPFYVRKKKRKDCVVNTKR